tara:strand:+ start:621 stop:812 length:192 start_codon:yes stop_codon:yes gene_type:complete
MECILMGKVKEMLLEDMQINPDKYNNPKWDDFVPEIIEHCNKTNKPASDVIKEVKEELAMKNW